ncbi:hypothetical protein SBDP1_1190021 [Syntrophobacter sp. SbD1]|nr:hypothetical protein SBDP1_1190021 [Syntrophobacter sp. SbD1]
MHVWRPVEPNIPDYLDPPRISLEILTQALSMQNVGQPGEFMNKFRETEG